MLKKAFRMSRAVAQLADQLAKRRAVLTVRKEKCMMLFALVAA